MVGYKHVKINREKSIIVLIGFQTVVPCEVEIDLSHCSYLESKYVLKRLERVLGCQGVVHDDILICQFSQASVFTRSSTSLRATMKGK